LEPLRAAVDRAQTEARDALYAMDDDCKGTMAWDSCEDAIEHLRLDWLHAIRHDVRDNVWAAEHRREGYDTWSREALRGHITCLKRLLDALTTLVATLTHLQRRETAELAATCACT